MVTLSDMKYVLTILFVLMVCTGWAQNDYLKFTDYNVARPLINPATVGMESGFNGLLMYQTCFESSDVRPSLGAFNINSALKNKNLGGGVSVIYDKYGPYQKTSAYLAFSYKLKVNEGKNLFFGLQAGVNYVTNDPSKYHRKDYEAAIEEKIDLSQPNFGIGLHLQAEKYCFGVSIPEFLYNYIDWENNRKESGFVSDKMHFYVYGAYRFDLGKNTMLEPYSYITSLETDKIQVDLGARLIYRDAFSIGLQYRTEESVGVMARVRLLDELWLGYSFENNSDASPYFNSLQEISVTFHFGKRSKKSSSSESESFDNTINSIRYF